MEAWRTEPFASCPAKPGADAGRTRGGRRHETETDGAVARARPGLGEAGRPPTAQEPLRGLAWRRAAKAAARERRAAGRGLRGGVGRLVPAFAVTLGDPTSLCWWGRVSADPLGLCRVCQKSQLS